ncbi:MAG: hypothetical protein H7Z42_21120 [Roseiflexaceae bacterium]|nr:hypothetical protein [Roseiflexaceae bacterium]
MHRPPRTARHRPPSHQAVWCGRLQADPRTTVDRSTPDGAHIPIEYRDPDEVAVIAGRRMLPAGVAARNPVFDVTPARFVKAIVTETGVVTGPYGF